MDRIGDAPFALLGEASHGTHEFYSERAEITKRLIEEKHFVAVAVEADWPDAYRVNRYVRGVSNDIDAAEALADFRRFPTWMWRNTVVVEFIEWLRAHNDALAPGATKVGFYGLDLYSLHASMKAVLRYLEQSRPRSSQAGTRALFLLRPFRRRHPGLWVHDALEPLQIMRGGGRQPIGRAAAPGSGLCAT